MWIYTYVYAKPGCTRKRVEFSRESYQQGPSVWVPKCIYVDVAFHGEPSCRGSEQSILIHEDSLTNSQNKTVRNHPILILHPRLNPLGVSSTRTQAYIHMQKAPPPQPLEEQTISAVERNDYYSLLWPIKSISMDSTIAVRSSIIAIMIIIIAIIPHVVPIVARLHGA